ncbi:unnamed protein product, partial [Colletotrichum noveboracense]
MQTHGRATAVRSIEGWIVMVTNVHEEADERPSRTNSASTARLRTCTSTSTDEAVTSRHGYALIEYATLAEARAAINDAHETKLLDQTVYVDF